MRKFLLKYISFYLQIGERIGSNPLLFTRPSFKSIYLAIFPNISIALLSDREKYEGTNIVPPPCLIPPWIHTSTSPPDSGFLATKVNGFDRGINSREIIPRVMKKLPSFPNFVVADGGTHPPKNRLEDTYFSPNLIPLRGVQ